MRSRELKVRWEGYVEQICDLIGIDYKSVDASNIRNILASWAESPFCPKCKELMTHSWIECEDGSGWISAWLCGCKETSRAVWICQDCGNKYGEHRCNASTWHEGKCDWCCEVKPVTESRDFGYPEKERE